MVLPQSLSSDGESTEVPSVKKEVGNFYCPYWGTGSTRERVRFQDDFGNMVTYGGAGSAELKVCINASHRAVLVPQLKQYLQGFLENHETLHEMGHKQFCMLTIVLPYRLLEEQDYEVLLFIGFGSSVDQERIAQGVVLALS